MIFYKLLFNGRLELSYEKHWNIGGVWIHNIHIAWTRKKKA